MQQVGRRRHHRRGPRVAEVALQRPVFGVGGAAADAQAQVASPRRPSRAAAAFNASTPSCASGAPAAICRATSLHIARAPARGGLGLGQPRADARHVGERAAEVLETRAAGVLDRRGERGARDPDAARRRAEHEPRQRRRHHQREARSRARRAGGPSTRSPRTRSGADALPRMPSPSNARADLDAGRSAPTRYRSVLSGSSEPGRAARQHVGVRLARRRREALVGVDHHAARRHARARDLRPEMPARAALGEGKRGEVLAARGRGQRRVLRAVRLSVAVPAASVCIATTCITKTIAGRRARAGDLLDRVRELLGPPPAPPKCSGTPSPSQPASTSATREASGKRASRSTVPAAEATGSKGEDTLGACMAI